MAAEGSTMTRFAIGLFTLCLLAAPAAAQSQAKWGALAFGGTEWGAGLDYTTADEARQAALESCGGACSQTIVFHRSCAAVVQNADKSMTWATSRWRGRAIARAMQQCGNTGSDCRVVVAGCTRH
jgi:hypothetical protein